MIQLTYITLFPELIESYFQEGLLSRAVKNQLLEKNVIQLRDFSKNKYKSIDGKSYGGGDGMVFSPEPVHEALLEAKKKFVAGSKNKIVLLSPQGKVCNQELLSDFSKLDHIVFICGRYAGFDQRITALCDMEVSIGDYVLSGGELPALVLTEGLLRHREGFLGNAESLIRDSFALKADGEGKLLEAPQFTEPADFQGEKVPEVLLSGHHQKIAEWKEKMALLITLKKRPDLTVNCAKKYFPKDVRNFYKKLTDAEKKLLGIENLDAKIEELFS